MKTTLNTFKTCLITLIMVFCFSGILLAQTGTTEAVRPTNWADQNAGTEENPYLIANLANLRWLSENSNDWWQNDTTIIHFRQTANINAQETSLWNSNQGFQPIGHAGSSNLFVGVYDGGNFNISNIYIRRNSASIGFFNRINHSTIKNLHLANVDMGGGSIGVLAYSACNSTIYNCSTSGSVNNAGAVGGVVSNMEYSANYQSNIIENCFSSVNITNASGFVGGLVATVYSSNYGNADFQIINSYSSGNINTTGSYNSAGGLVGNLTNYNAPNTTISIQNSFSTGNISATINQTSGTVPNAGGIIGNLNHDYSSNVTYEIINCYSTGNVIATSSISVAPGHSGGIIGRLNSSIGNPANISFNIKDSYSTGEISGLTAGGIVGYLYNSHNIATITFNIQNCYSSGNISGVVTSSTSQHQIGGIVGYAYSQNLARISIQNTFSSANLIASNNSSRVGGIAGFSNYTNIQNSFSSGSISVSGTNSIGSGIVGYADAYTVVTNSYSTANISGSIVSGLVGDLRTNSSVSNSFWDTEATETPRGIWFLSGTSTNNHGLPTIEMKQASTYIDNGWDFSEVWALMPDINDGYPFLRAITDVPPSPPGSPTNLIGTMEDNNILLYWELPDVRTLVSFTVYRNGVEIEDGITSTFYIDETVVNNTQYSYTVAAVYTTHTSDPSFPFNIWTRFPVRNLASTFEGSDVVLSWQAPLGGTVNGYRVYKEGEAITTSPITTLTFTDIAAEPGTTYTYQVRAVYTSGMSQPVDVTLTTPLFNPPTGLTAEVVGVDIHLTWVAPDMSSDFATLDGYKVYRNNVALTDVIDDLFYTDDTVAGGFQYSYYVTAVYSEPYGESVPSNVVTEGTEAPEVFPPAGLEGNVGDGRVVLTWQLPGSTRGVAIRNEITQYWLYDEVENIWYNDNSLTRGRYEGTRQSLLSFNVYRDDILLVENVKQTRYIDTNVLNQTAYNYYVTAVYVNPDVESEPSNDITITTRFPIRELTAQLFGYDVRLNWTAPNGGGASGYEIYRNDTLINTVTALNFTDEDTVPGTAYVYTIHAVYNNVQSPAVSVFMIIPIFTPPGRFIAAAHLFDVALSWEAPEPHVYSGGALLGYNVFRNEILVTIEPILETFYFENDLIEGSYEYKLTAVYEQGESEVITGELLRLPVFNPPLNLSAEMVNDSVWVSWELPGISRQSRAERTNELNRNTLVSFTVYRDDVILAENVTSTFYMDNAIENNTLYNYHAVAVYNDPDGVSEPSNSAEITIVFPPRSLSTTFEGRDVVLNWLAPLGGGNNGYNVSRNGENLNSSLITTLTFTDEAALPGTTYTYQVTAVYDIGVSIPIEITLLTPLFNPPTGLIAEIVEKTVSLEWVAPDVSADFANLDGYIVYRNDEPITDTIVLNNYLDVDVLVNELYDYYVVAVYSEPYGQSVPSNSANIIITEMPAPKELTADIGDGIVILTWALPANRDEGQLRSNLAGFKVYRNNTLISDVVNQTYFIDNTAENITLYTYYVTAVYAEPEAESQPSNSFTITTRYPVRNLQLTLIGHSVSLEWTPPSGTAPDGYNVYRNDSLSNNELLSELSYMDNNTTPADEYTYQIMAVYDGVESPAVSSSLIIPYFNPPRNLVAYVSNLNVELIWEQPEILLEFEVLLGYIVYRDDVPQTIELLTNLFFMDTLEVSGEYVYKVTAKYELGESVPVEIKVDVHVSEIEEVDLVYETALLGNYPNPFNPETIIGFSMKEAGNVVIEVFNVRGQKIKMLVDEYADKGEHRVVWNGTDDNGRNVVSGVYFYRMNTGGFVDTKRMLLMK